ncbi:hypothetical protein BU183_04610, partial [Enterococcus faecium]
MHKDLLSFSVEQLLDSFIIPAKENAF